MVPCDAHFGTIWEPEPVAHSEGRKGWVVVPAGGDSTRGMQCIYRQDNIIIIVGKEQHKLCEHARDAVLVKLEEKQHWSCQDVNGCKDVHFCICFAIEYLEL